MCISMCVSEVRRRDDEALRPKVYFLFFIHFFYLTFLFIEALLPELHRGVVRLCLCVSWCVVVLGLMV